MKDEVRTEEGK